MKCMSIASTVSCIDMAGANWLRVRVIPRRIRQNKTRFKKTVRAKVALEKMW